MAARQHGNITRKQLLALGLDDKAISRRVDTGVLFRVHLAVYSVGRPPQTPLERAAAAVLACGPTAVLSHASALALWGLAKRWSTPFEVTITGDRRPRGISVHRSRTLTRSQTTRHLGIRVTTPARTIHDCEPRLADKALTRTVNEALLSRYLTRAQLIEFLIRTPNARLAPFAAADDGPTRSEFEDAFLILCDESRIARPKMNTIVCGREVDAYFERERVIVELDGWAYHSSRHSFEDDRDRDANALVNGIPTVRLTWGGITGRPEQEGARLRAILASRG